MSSAKENNRVSSCNEYEQERNENVASIKRVMADLNIPEIVKSMSAQGQPRKTSKKIHSTTISRTEQPNLRPRPQRNTAPLEEEQVQVDLQPLGDFLNNNEGHEDLDLSNVGNNKKGRGITVMDDIFSRTPEMPKLKVLVNEHGQPKGENASKLSSAIGCHVRKNISIACYDWRLVHITKKQQIWTEMKKYFDIDDACLNWVLRTAGNKWKEFKSTIKDLYFYPDLNIDEVPECPDKRVSDDDWKFLCNYWKTPEFEARSSAAKRNRQKKKVHHTSGSMSFACAEYELTKKLKRPARRDEIFIKTHSRKNGVPSAQARPIIFCRTNLRKLLRRIQN